jgi:hypothetical protein|uniref:Uncharacterized protein n=1 Tax=Myoviridae sp. ctPJU6 TaxID=2827684 RepID=A0A8S5TJ47_9CAUD|nr:MAG TPA: hypothetical protein [Myoviridae sp. ctPJU6]
MRTDFWGREKPLKNDMGMSVGEEKPKIGEEYYCLVLDKPKFKVVKRKWKNNNVDMIMFITGNIYSSKDKAEADKGRSEI